MIIVSFNLSWPPAQGIHVQHFDKSLQKKFVEVSVLVVLQSLGLHSLIQWSGNLLLSALQTVLFWLDSALFLQRALNLIKNSSIYQDKFYSDPGLSIDML